MDTEGIRKAARLLRQSRCTVALTGAGISTPSGIPDFRSPGTGAWEQADPMEVASIYSFRANPRIFYEWVKPLARAMYAAQPNPAHIALAQLEALGWLAAVITQNIDMLHTRAGSKTVFEVHGHFREAVCIHCHRVLPAASLMQAWLDHDELPSCPECGHAMKPNVTFYGEQLPEPAFTEATLAARKCEVMLVVGSSLEVFPAAELPALALRRGAKVIIVNREPTYVDERAAVVIDSDVALALPALVDEVSHVLV